MFSFNLPNVPWNRKLQLPHPAILFATIVYSYYKNAPLEDAWTLAVEEQFYLVFPFIVAACNLKTFRMICWLLIPAGFIEMRGHKN